MFFKIESRKCAIFLKILKTNNYKILEWHQWLSGLIEHLHLLYFSNKPSVKRIKTYLFSLLLRYQKNSDEFAEYARKANSPYFFC